MRAGELREAVSIQEPIETRDDIGGVQTVWSTLATVRGKVVSLTGKEALEAQQIEARLSHKITLRLPNCLTEKGRLVVPPNCYTGMGERIFAPYGIPEMHGNHFEMCVYAMEVR